LAGHDGNHGGKGPIALLLFAWALAAIGSLSAQIMVICRRLSTRRGQIAQAATRPPRVSRPGFWVPRAEGAILC